MNNPQDRVLSRRDLGTAAQILKSARDGYRAAGDAAGTSEVDAVLIKVKADIVMRAIETAREVGARTDEYKKVEGESVNGYSTLSYAKRRCLLDWFVTTG